MYLAPAKVTMAAAIVKAMSPATMGKATVPWVTTSPIGSNSLNNTKDMVEHKYDIPTYLKCLANSLELLLRRHPARMKPPITAESMAISNDGAPEG
jgi:hypothetical protein